MRGQRVHNPISIRLEGLPQKVDQERATQFKLGRETFGATVAGDMGTHKDCARQWTRTPLTAVTTVVAKVILAGTAHRKEAGENQQEQKAKAKEQENMRCRTMPRVDFMQEKEILEKGAERDKSLICQGTLGMTDLHCSPSLGWKEGDLDLA